MDPKLLGQRIKEARLAKKMTQTEVVGSFITRNMLSQIESGNAVPSMKTLTYLAQVLELPPSVLLPDVGEGADSEQDGDATVSVVPPDASVFFRAKEAYLSGDDTNAYEMLSSIEDASPISDEAQALFARIALRLANARCSEENYSEALELSKAAATSAAKGLYASTEIKSQALLLLSEAAAKLAQI